ncbi:transposase [Haloterrigena turkmenica]|uniref:transposase n=1 Tax=Haloterrigena turkmenica TaxID=62320 RepID=UPI001CF7B584|nr:transposase [Haloterrigena turkmenica]
MSRDGDAFHCYECGLGAHSDITGAWNLLQDNVGPMARPAALLAEHDRDAPDSGAY